MRDTESVIFSTVLAGMCFRSETTRWWYAAVWPDKVASSVRRLWICLTFLKPIVKLLAFCLKLVSMMLND